MYVKIFSDELLADFFKKTDKERQKEMQRQFLTHLTGGSSDYKGKSMIDAHKGRGAQTKEFFLVLGHIVSAMYDLKVDAKLIGEMGVLLAPLKQDIIS
jgi:truncated hemoglobin YjbI